VTDCLELASLGCPRTTANPSSTKVPKLASFQVWNTRAWMLQEVLLSNRLLISNDYCLSFYWNGSAICEDRGYLDGTDALYGEVWGSGLTWEPTSGSPITRAFRAESFSAEKYANLAHLYYSRNISNQSDALNAVSGFLEH
jgi:hypothetical protein